MRLFTQISARFGHYITHLNQTNIYRYITTLPSILYNSVPFVPQSWPVCSLVAGSDTAGIPLERRHFSPETPGPVPYADDPVERGQRIDYTHGFTLSVHSLLWIHMNHCIRRPIKRHAVHGGPYLGPVRH